MFVKPFEELSKADAGIAGGKGASLGEMTNAGIAVPPGFVILSEAFDTFILETEIKADIDAILHKVNHNDTNSIEHASEKIRAVIMAEAIPENIRKEIKSAFRGLNSRFVAVRSSATSEDSAAAAWAGQLESYLNTTETDLLENVKKCWASLFTPRAIFYRFEQNMHNQNISVAVVVQKMVESEVSGIAFSVHPVTQDYNQLIIEAGYGLGESIVSGQITPDSYVVEKLSTKIIEKDISTQEKGLFRSPNGGNKWQSPNGKRDAQKLNDKEIIELSKLIIKIEKHYGFPVDTEWAREKGKFYITQSRPITTLNKTPVVTKFLERDGKVQELIKRLHRFTFHRELKFPWVPIPPVMPYFPAYVNNPYLKKTRKLSNAINITIITDKYESWENLSGKPIISDKSEIRELINDCKNYITKYPPKLLKLQKRMDGASDEELKAIFNELSEMTIEINRPNVPLNENSFETKDPALLKQLPFIRDQYSEKVITLTWDSFNKLLKDVSERRDLDLKRLENLMTEELRALISGAAVDLPKPRRPLAFVIIDNHFSIYLGNDVLRLKEYLDGNDPEKNDAAHARETGIIKGKPAHPGKVIGRVLKLNEKDYYRASEILKGKKDYILVTPMTRPEISHYLKNASAFVTDEGGITAHAVIVAREMNKPCIIGTKIGTQVLKDGDLVEVDADKGTVKIIG